MTLQITDDNLAKIKNVIQTGVESKTLIKDTTDSLNEVIKEVSKELDIKPKLLREAIKAAFIAKLESSKEQVLEDKQKELDDISIILEKISL